MWQNIIAVILFAAALAYVGYIVYTRVRKKKDTTGCDDCPGGGT